MPLTREEAWQVLDSLSVQISDTLLDGWKKTSRRAYRDILAHANVTSYSQLEVFSRCPRKFQMMKEQAFRGKTPDEQSTNIDFSFGHAVGAGVQSFIAERDEHKALLSCVLAWGAGIEDEIKSKKKSLYSAMLAVERFIHLYTAGELLEDWEILTLPTGQPAVEISFSVHCHNGFKHYSHMDLGLRNRRTGEVGVCDVKTTGFTEPEEALYGNSSQSLSYSIMLDRAVPEEVVIYDVYYLVYSSVAREWALLEFRKNILDQAEYIKDLLLTHEQIRTYNELRFFPKRGSACFDFMRRCQFYGECNLTQDEPLPEISAEQEAEEVDYTINLQEVIARLKARKHNSETGARE